MSGDNRHNGGPPIDDDNAIGRNGWVAIARAMREHHLVGFGRRVEPADPSRLCFSRAEAWIDLIMECRWAPGRIMNGGRMMEIKPGQLLGATSWLANRWNWTPKTVRTFLEKLQADNMIERTTPGTQTTPGSPYSSDGIKHGQQKGKQAQFISVCNYDIYQLSGREQGQANWHANGKQGASKGQARGNTITREQGNNEDYPPTPQGGSAEPAAPQAAAHNGVAQPIAQPDTAQPGVQDLLAALSPDDLKVIISSAQRDRTKRLRSESRAAENAKRKALADEGFDLYNRAAAHFGFAVCESITEDRRSKMLERLDAIGGIENFKIALRAIGRDDFLMGRKARPGQEPFRLDFERLMSTRSGMGDVLARLLDASARAEQQPQVGPNGKAWGWWRTNFDKLRALDADYWRRRIDALKPNGTWPWWELGAPPGHEEAIVHPDVIAELGLAEIYKGKVQHD